MKPFFWNEATRGSVIAYLFALSDAAAKIVHPEYRRNVPGVAMQNGLLDFAVSVPAREL